MTASKRTGLPVDAKRSRAARKAAATRKANSAARAEQGRELRLHHKLLAVGGVAVVLILTVLAVKSELDAFAASTSSYAFTGLSGKCLDNSSGTLAKNNRIQLWRCNGTTPQKWVVTANGSLKANNGSSYCIDIPSNTKTEFTYVRLWPCNDTAAQRFTISGNKIASKTTGYCLTVHYSESANGTRLWMVKCNDAASQRWTRAAATQPVSSGAPTQSPATAGSPSTGSNGVKYGTVEHPFSAKSPWNTPIPANPAVDPDSSKINAAVVNNKGLVLNMILYAFGQPTYVSTANTPYITLGGRVTHWTMPMDPVWRQNEGADGKMNVFDTKTGYSYELQDYNPGNKTAYWGVKHNYVTGLADGYPTDGELRGPTGSGMSQLAGLIRISDIKSGSIEHALSFITSDPQANSYRYPASGTDGKRGAPYGIAEGMRLQLDPSLNVDAIPGITPGEKMVAKALQKYGAYCTDTGGGNNMAAGFYAEKPTSGDDPYPSMGWKEDWAQLPHIPRDKIRVLAESVTKRP